MGNEQSITQGRNAAVSNSTTTKMNPRKRTNEEAFPVPPLLASSNTHPKNSPIIPVFRSPREGNNHQRASSITRAEIRQVYEPEQRPTERDDFGTLTWTGISRLRSQVMELTQQLAASRAKQKEAEDLRSFRRDFKSETNTAIRLTRENRDLARKWREDEIEIGELQGMIQEEEIRGDRLKAENDNLKRELRETRVRVKDAEVRFTMLEEQLQREKDQETHSGGENLSIRRELQEVQLRAEVAEARVVILEKQLQSEEDRADQLEAANIDITREVQDAKGRAKHANEDIADLQDEARFARKRITDLERQLRIADEQKRGLQGQLAQFQERAKQVQSLLRNASAPQRAKQAQNTALLEQERLQNLEQLHFAYEKSLADGFATAKEIIADLQISVEEKENQIQKLQAQEKVLSKESTRLENHNSELATQVEALKETVENRSAMIKDAISELTNSRVRWEEEIKRNAAAEQELRDESVKEQGKILARMNKEGAASEREISKLEEEKLVWFNKYLDREKALKRSVENQAELREQIDMLEEQIQEMMNERMVSDNEGNEASDSASISSTTEPGSLFDASEDEEDKEACLETLGYERHPFGALSTLDFRGGGSLDVQFEDSLASASTSSEAEEAWL
jgi:cell division protein ZapA